MRKRCCTVSLVVSVTTAVMVWPLTASAEDPTIPPPRAGLHAVPIPQLDTVEPAVAGQIRAEEGKVRGAIAQRSGSSNLASAYGSLAVLFHAYEIFDNAEPAYLNAARLAPGEPRWPYMLGYLYQQTGRFDEAATQFAAVLQRQTEHREASARLAAVYLQLNRLRDAREQFRGLIDVFPAYARNGLGEVALREGRFEEAAGHFRAALERVPQATALHYSLAMAYRGLGLLDRARAELARRGPGEIRLGDPAVDGLADLVQGERLLVLQGRRAVDAGDLQAAADRFARAIAAVPDSVAARANLASVLVQLGQPLKAIEQLEALVRLNPADEESTINLAILLSDRSRFADAVDLLTRAYTRSPDAILTATTLARLLAAAPDPGVRDGTRALELAMRVYGLKPSSVHGETVALALLELRRCAEALDWMRRAILSAEQLADAAEGSRLQGELGKYERCQR